MRSNHNTRAELLLVWLEFQSRHQSNFSEIRYQDLHIFNLTRTLHKCWSVVKFKKCWELSVFLSGFWVSKWHPKFWKLRYGFALYWSKRIWDKHIFLHVAIATDGCNVLSQHKFLVQKLEAKIVSLVSVHCHAHRFGLNYTAADLYGMVCETAKAL